MRKREIESQLTGKFRFSRVKDAGDAHKWYELTLLDVPTVKVKVSHGTSEPGPTLVRMMANQLRVPSKYFQAMVGCTTSMDEYYALLRRVFAHD